MQMLAAVGDAIWLRFATAPIAGSVLVGLIALGTLRWHRNETRRKALSEMLRSYVKAAQQMKRANDARLKCERIFRNFAPGQHTEVAQASIKQLQELYSHHQSQGLDAFINFEAEFAANKFRFKPMTNAVLSE